jgi:chromosome segregation protein
MHLNHLVLQGFKSFATKTEFLFPTGITAIVGPNGSGKSNIADAISWALGEQRMRTLRAKSTADMIFGGGRRRARAGMAEVSLTFDNADSWLPIEFSEVTFTRRAYRSGENEYLINGSRVRLRDITQLLAESGLSQRTYTVIGQGLVDAALSLRPQERRMLFEDAAGIGYYRAQREDAVGRLDETQHNLERVYDIINEITPRLQKLERETRRVQEHQRLTAHLERLQRTWYGYQWGQQQVELDRAVEVASVLEAELEEREREESELGSRQEELRRREGELRASLRDWLRERADLYDRINELQRELAVSGERARLLQVRREELEAELGPLDAQREAQVEQVSQTVEYTRQLEGDLQARKERLAELQREWTAVEARVEQSVVDHTRTEQELRVRRARLEQLNQALLKERAEAARLAGEQEALNRVRALKTSHDDSVQAVLEARLPGVIGPLDTLLTVPQKWEHAIEAALGADLQAVVVEKAAVVSGVRRILKSVGGRLVLLPLDSLRAVPSLPSGSLCAADVVSCAEKARPAVEATLGVVALCDDLKTAYGLLPSMPSGSRCVTASGIVLRSDGALVVGWNGGSGDGVGQVVDGATPQDLAARIDETRGSCDEIENQQRIEAEKIAAIEATLAELNRQASVVREEAAQIERETVGKARTEIAVAEEALRSQRAASQRESLLLDRLEAQVSARRQRVKDLEAEQAALTVRTGELRAEAADLETQQSNLRVRIQPTEDELARIQKEQIVLEERQHRARDRAREIEARQSRAQLDVARCRDELTLLARRIEEDLGLVELELSGRVTAQSPLPLRPMVSRLPIVEELPDGLQDEIKRLKARLHRLGAVNPNAPDDYAEIQERHDFLTAQASDLDIASAQLRKIVEELDELMAQGFQEIFEKVAEEFSAIFSTLFGGGSARLELSEPDDLLNTGVDIIARPPGKRAQTLALLSGGERALTAVSLLFAILRANPAPFCVLDEVDAMLDEANVGRFRALLDDLSQRTQFIVITHNRSTIESADTLYGISMSADAVSQVVSLKLD